MTVTYTGDLPGSDGSTLHFTGTLVPPQTSTGADGGTTVTTPHGPGRVQALWHQGWKGPAITSYPEPLLNGLTHLELDMCQSGQAGTGKLADPPGVTAAQIDQVTGRGIRVFAGIGGGSDGGILLTTATHVTQMLDSVKSMVSRLHIAGITFDLEGAPGSKWQESAAADLGHALVADGIGVAICSALWGGRGAAWGRVARELGTGLSWWERMFYDFTEARDQRLSAIVAGQDGFTTMRPYLAGNAQLVATFMPTDPGDANTSPVPVITAAYAAGTATYPGAGWAVFHDANDGPGYAATRALLAAR